MFEIRAGGAVPAESADSLVVAVYEGGRYDGAGEWAASHMGEWLGPYLEGAGFEGKLGQVVTVPGGDLPYRTVVFTGLGADPGAEDVRRAAGAAGRAAMRAATVATSLHLAAGEDGPAALVEGFALGQYRFDRHRTDPKPGGTSSLILLDAGEADMESADRGRIVAGGVALARDLVN